MKKDFRCKVLIMDKDDPKALAEKFFADEINADTAVSFSDSRGLSAFALCPGQTAIGVDLEDFSCRRISSRDEICRKTLGRLQLEQICKRHFPLFVQEELLGLSDADFQERFFYYWVCTEALLKATRQGLDLNTIQNAVEAVARCPGTAQWQGATWHLSWFKPYPQCILALAQSRKTEIELLYENNR